MVDDSLRALEAEALAGDPGAFGLLIRRLDGDLRRLAWSVLRDNHAVDDVLQQTYEKAFRSLAKFDGRSTIKTWMHSICYRTALDHIRYESRRRHTNIDEAELPVAQSPTSDSVLSRAELRELVDQLDPAVRAALLMTAGLGFSFDEVAAITGEKRGTVAARVSRARQRIERW